MAIWPSRLALCEQGIPKTIAPAASYPGSRSVFAKLPEIARQPRERETIGPQQALIRLGAARILALVGLVPFADC